MSVFIYWYIAKDGSVLYMLNAYNTSCGSPIKIRSTQDGQSELLLALDRFVDGESTGGDLLALKGSLNILQLSG